MIYDDICAMQDGLFGIYRHTEPLGFSWHCIKVQNGIIMKMYIYSLSDTDYKYGRSIVSIYVLSYHSYDSS